MSTVAAHLPASTQDELIWGAYRDFKHSQVAARDGTLLDVYEYGLQHGPPVIVVNAIGVPLVLASRLMRRLGERNRVVSWEQRGCRTELKDFLTKPHDFGSFVADLVRVVEATGGADGCSLVAICSGAGLAIRAVAEKLVTATSLILVSPSVRFAQGYSPSIFDLAVVPYMHMVADGNLALAQNMLDLGAVHQSHQNANTGADQHLIHSADRWSLRSIDSLVVYAKTVRAFSAQQLDSDFPRVHQKVLVLCAADDRTLSIASVRRLTELLPDAVLVEEPSGGHFLVFLSAEVQSRICEAIESAMNSP